jgi:repressor LexA
MPEQIRPTKKQLELLEFIEQFISEHGYSPSYREIMVGCNYTSVATVALHVNSLISRGHLVKRDKSARSLELTAPTSTHMIIEREVSETESKWLVTKIDGMFANAEANEPSQKLIDELFVLVGALKVLNLHDAANSFMPRLKALRSKTVK